MNEAITKSLTQSHTHTHTHTAMLAAAASSRQPAKLKISVAACAPHTLAITLITLNYRKLGVHEDFQLRTIVENPSAVVSVWVLANVLVRLLLLLLL